MVCIRHLKVSDVFGVDVNVVDLQIKFLAFFGHFKSKLGQNSIIFLVTLFKTKGAFFTHAIYQRRLSSQKMFYFLAKINVCI